MTQEELDALVDDAADLNIDETASEENAQKNIEEEIVEGINSNDYRVSSDSKMAWPPPPPNQEHKIVHQLDEVTKDSEVKAIEVMDKLDTMSKLFSDSEISLKKIKQSLEKNVEIFTILSEKFPNVQTFKDALESNKASIDISKNVTDSLQQGQDEIFTTMDIMQYQDIHRQKIERAINIMRALSRYMNSLFESKIDDKKRVSSAVHIPGDSTADLVDDNDIEDLIASLRQNK